jgi:hypothetical protein
MQSSLSYQTSLSALNYCLKPLIDKGFVKLDSIQQINHKLMYACILTPAGIAQKMAMTGRFLMRKMEEYEALKAGIEKLQQKAEPPQ